MNIGNNTSTGYYIRYKRTDLKWYQKLRNILTGHKDRNWNWVEIKSFSTGGTWGIGGR